METITRFLSDAYEFHFIGLGYKGPVITGKVTIYPNNLEGGDVYGAYHLKKRIAELNPDFVFLLNDVWMLANYGVICAEESKRIPFVAYAAIDGKIVEPFVCEGLTYLAKLVAYTTFARQELEQAFDCSNEYVESYRPVLEVIPHGVDTSVFFPIDQRVALKHKYFPILVNPETSFIILNANRPHSRKRIDLTIQGFAAFSRGKPDNVILYLHHAVMFEQEYQRLKEWITEAEITDRVVLSEPDLAYIDDAGMNEIYNACDVGLNTSMGEGWGMVSMEHAATCRTQIVPNHSACEEIWQGVGETVAISNSYVPEFSPLELSEVAVAEISAALEKLYTDRQLRENTASRCYSHVVSDQFQWDNISQQWDRVFTEVVER